MDRNRLKGLVESLIFVSDNPLSLKDMASVIDEADEIEIQDVLDELETEYARNLKGLAIRKVAGGYQIHTNQVYYPWIQKLFDEKRARKLSESALETLAIVAYRQPITIPEINQIRGVQSQGVVKTLLVKKLIIVRGTKIVIGRPRLYGTSEEFMIKFGINDIKDLPPLEEFSEILENTEKGDEPERPRSDRTEESGAVSLPEGIKYDHEDSESHLDDGNHIPEEGGEVAD